MHTMLEHGQESCPKREALLKQITMMDFMALDLHLYLNMHPTDCEALEMYNDCTIGAKVAREKYEAEYGPLTGFRSEGQKSDGTKGWAWNDCPWPWQANFNFSLN